MPASITQLRKTVMGIATGTSIHWMYYGMSIMYKKHPVSVHAIHTRKIIRPQI